MKKYFALVIMAGILLFPVRPAQGAPIVVVVIAAVAVVGVVDYISCTFDIIFIDSCGNGGGGGGGYGSGFGGGALGPSPGGSSGSSGAPGGGGSGSSTACSGAANACGMVNTGFVVGGSCNATPPPNSSCPPPVMGAGSFEAQPDRVRSGNASILYWGGVGGTTSIADATTCSLSGGGLSLPDIGLSGSEETGPITVQTNFTLSCENGLGGPITSAQVTVGLIPEFEEI